MRIAYVTFEYPPFILGGAGVHAKCITQELARIGHEIVVFTPSLHQVFNKSSFNNVNSNLKVIHIPTNEKLPFKALQFWIKLPKAVKASERERKFDIIHFNGISYWFLKTRIADAPHIVTIHHLVKDAILNQQETFLTRFKNISGETGFLLPLIEKKCIQSVDKIISVSKYTRDQIIRTYDIDESKIVVVYNGIDNSGYSFSQNELDEIKIRYNIDDTPIVLFVGRIDDRRKGLDILIEAFKQVLRSVDAQLVVIGRGKKPEINDSDNYLDKKMHFIGYTDDITLKKFYSLCTVYICPSRLEGFGLTILEALTAGKPVVATNVGAIPELIQDGKNGIIVEMNDIPNMVSAILFYLKNQQISEHIKSNFKDYIEKFNWQISAINLERIYGELRFQ